MTGTAVYGTVRTVVWEDGGSNSASYPIPQTIFSDINQTDPQGLFRVITFKDFPKTIRQGYFRYARIILLFWFPFIINY